MTFYQYPIYDHRGTVVRLTDENAAICATYKTNAWGLPLGTSTSTTTNHFRYQSNWMTLDDSNGIILLSPTRLYHVKVGRFLQRDMLGFVDGLNLYRAFRGNPMGYVDAEGTQGHNDLIRAMAKNRKEEDIRQKQIKQLKEITSNSTFPFEFTIKQLKGNKKSHITFLKKVITHTQEEWKQNWRARELFLNRFFRLEKFNAQVNNSQPMKVELVLVSPTLLGIGGLPWAQYNPKYDVIVFNADILDEIFEKHCEGKLLEAFMQLLFHEPTHLALNRIAEYEQKKGMIQSFMLRKALKNETKIRRIRMPFDYLSGEFVSPVVGLLSQEKVIAMNFNYDIPDLTARNLPPYLVANDYDVSNQVINSDAKTILDGILSTTIVNIPRTREVGETTEFLIFGRRTNSGNEISKEMEIWLEDNIKLSEDLLFQ